MKSEVAKIDNSCSKNFSSLELEAASSQKSRELSSKNCLARSKRFAFEQFEASLSEHCARKMHEASLDTNTTAYCRPKSCCWGFRGIPGGIQSRLLITFYLSALQMGWKHVLKGWKRKKRLEKQKEAWKKPARSENGRNLEENCVLTEGYKLNEGK